jgi:predicted ATPase/DNA-binding SARP family transcriptional activator
MARWTPGDVLRFQLLGSVQVERDGVALDLGPRLQRALLARLSITPDAAVSVDRIVDDLWGEHAPPRVNASLQAYISGLRRVLEPDRLPRMPASILVTRDPGYALVLHGHDLDVHAFEVAAAASRRLANQRSPVEAGLAADEALSLWRGDALADLVDDFAFARVEADRLSGLRAAVEDVRLASRVDTGGHVEAVGELERVVRAEPFRERGWELLLLALYRSGRIADALTRYGEAVTVFRDELGIDPGPALAALHRAILDRDPGLDAPLPSTAPRAEVRVPTGGPDAAGSAATRSGALPPEPPRLVGRDHDRDAILDLLGRGRLVTLTGPGGVGKTSLAQLVASGARDADAVVFVALASQSDARQLLPSVARSLGLRSATGDPLELIGRATIDRTVLVVLDNLEHLLGAATDVAALLDACPGVCVLATSRAPLLLRQEQEYPVPPLVLPDRDGPVTVTTLRAAPAARLFLDRARSYVPSFEPTPEEASAIAAIVRRLDGLPLALELAAAWIRVLRPDELLARLDRALPMLVGGATDLPDRQRTVRATVAWSYDLLDDHQRDTFAELAIFRGGWSLTAAAAVTATPGSTRTDLEVLGDHAALVERSLVVRERTDAAGPAPRFTMLETVREFGLEALAERGAAEDVAARHAAWFSELAEEAFAALLGPEQAGWLDRIAQDHDNLLQAMHWYRSRGDLDHVARIAWGICWYWHVRARQSEGRRWTADLLASPDLRPESRDRVLAVDALLAFGQGDWADPRRARDGDGEPADPEVAAVLDLAAGHLAVGRGDPVGATEAATAAARRYQQLGDPSGEGLAMLAVVQVLVAEGDLDGARRSLDDAEVLLRRAGAPWGLAVVLNIRVMMAQVSGGGDVRDLLRESLTLSASLRDVAASLYAITSLAEELLEAGQLTDAAWLFGAAEAMTERAGLAMNPNISLDLLQRAVTRLRGALDPAVLRERWDAGRELSPDAALAAALELLA